MKNLATPFRENRIEELAEPFSSPEPTILLACGRNRESASMAHAWNGCSQTFSSPEPTFLPACGRDRELWRQLWLGLTPEVRDSRTSHQIWLVENTKRKLCAYSENRVRPHSRPQNLRSFWPATRIESSGSNHFRHAPYRMGRIRLFPLLFQNGCSQSSRFLPQARRIVGSGPELPIPATGQKDRGLWGREWLPDQSSRFLPQARRIVGSLGTRMCERKWKFIQTFSGKIPFAPAVLRARGFSSPCFSLLASLRFRKYLGEKGLLAVYERSFCYYKPLPDLLFKPLIFLNCYIRRSRHLNRKATKCFRKTGSTSAFVSAEWWPYCFCLHLQHKRSACQKAVLR